MMVMMMMVIIIIVPSFVVLFKRLYLDPQFLPVVHWSGGEVSEWLSGAQLLAAGLNYDNRIYESFLLP